jgi:glutathione S-transferase
MTLRLYFHPLSSFCQKVLTALYENDTPFEGKVVNFMDPKEDAAFRELWPLRRFPVLRDEARDKLVPESTTIIEYLDRHFPGKTRLIPTDPDVAWETRFWDRFLDLYIHVPMQKIVTDRLRPAGRNDPHGVEEASRLLQTALTTLDADLASKTWAMGETFTMADCAAAPPLFYANEVMPFGGTHRNVAAYFARLRDRPSYARVLQEAKPYFDLFPKQ